MNGLARYAASLAADGNRVQALQYLANPAFTLGPKLTEARLENLPFMSTTNVATLRAAASMGGGSGTNDNQIP